MSTTLERELESTAIVQPTPSIERRLPRYSASTLFAILLIGLGCAPRIELMERFYLDFDESMHFQVAKEASLVDAYRASRIHTHPPLVFLIYHYWIRLGQSEQMLRVPSLLFGIGSLWLAYVWLRELTDRWAALAGLCFLTFSIPMIHASAQMRGYTLLLLFTFGALYLRERALKSQSLPMLIGSTACLSLAMLTHYGAAWIILTLGVLTMMRLAAERYSRSFIAVWVATQFWLLAICGSLLLGHATDFVGSQTQQYLWSCWLNDNRFGTGPIAAAKYSLFKLMQFLVGFSGRGWIVVGGLVAVGAAVPLFTMSRTRYSFLKACERSGLVLVPLIVAIALFNLRIYPLGWTRHNLWLVPFVAAGISIGIARVLAVPSKLRIGLVVVTFAAWSWSEGIAAVHSTDTSLTSANVQQYVEALRETVPRSELIVTDESTRNVLDYYLARGTLNPGRPLKDGLVEYQFDGYRVISIPEFHFFDIAKGSPRWSQFRDQFPADMGPIWITYLGFEIPIKGLEHLKRRLPPGSLLQRRSLLDNEILRIQLSPVQRTVVTQQSPAAPQDDQRH